VDINGTVPEKIILSSISPTLFSSSEIIFSTGSI